jgi:hypothetical protein
MQCYHQHKKSSTDVIDSIKVTYDRTCRRWPNTPRGSPVLRDSSIGAGCRFADGAIEDPPPPLLRPPRPATALSTAGLCVVQHHV